LIQINGVRLPAGLIEMINAKYGQVTLNEEALAEYEKYDDEYKRWWEHEAYWVYIEKEDTLHHFKKVL